MTQVKENKTRRMNQLDADVALIVQKGLELEAKGRNDLEEAFCKGYDIGFADGANAGYDKGQCETWDEAYQSGWRDCKEAEY